MPPMPPLPPLPPPPPNPPSRPHRPPRSRLRHSHCAHPAPPPTPPSPPPPSPRHRFRPRRRRAASIAPPPLLPRGGRRPAPCDAGSFSANATNAIGAESCAPRPPGAFCRRVGSPQLQRRHYARGAGGALPQPCDHDTCQDREGAAGAPLPGTRLAGRPAPAECATFANSIRAPTSRATTSSEACLQATRGLLLPLRALDEAGTSAAESCRQQPGGQECA